MSNETYQDLEKTNESETPPNLFKIRGADSYVVDFSKVTTLEDVIEILKAINITFHSFNDKLHSKEAQDLLDKGYLIKK